MSNLRLGFFKQNKLTLVNVSSGFVLFRHLKVAAAYCTIVSTDIGKEYLICNFHI